MILKPNIKTITPYYANYVRKAKGKDLISSLTRNMNATKKIIKTIPEVKYDFAYDELKWTAKQVIRHFIDTERVFAYRALTISRNDNTSLPGFSENGFADFDNVVNVGMDDLLKEFIMVRQSNILLFKGMNDTMLDYNGYIMLNKINARTLGWMISGHTEHHLGVLKERYLNV
jgi:DinB superfamily